MPINMTEEQRELLSNQLHRLQFILCGMKVDVEDLENLLFDDDMEWPEEADIMLDEMTTVVEEAQEKIWEIAGYIRR